jgi:hypothetical protein
MFLGIVFFCLWNEYIVILPSAKKEEKIAITEKRKVMLSFYAHDKWNHEEQEILWTGALSKNIEYVINAWLQLLYDEKITKKKISVESILISSAQTAYISTDHLIFSKEDAIFNKWMIIESLLKTMKENNFSVNSVQLLVNHTYCTDHHLDLNRPWPITGFKK